MKKAIFTLFAFFALSLSLLAQSVNDYRSITSGSWYDIANWETYNGTTWVVATAYPNAANSVTILATHNITIPAAGAAITINKLVVSGSLIDNSTAANQVTVSKTSGDDISVENGGKLIFNSSANYGVAFIFSGTPQLHVKTGGTVQIGTGGAVGSGYDVVGNDQMTGVTQVWDDASLLLWNSTIAPALRGKIYFAGAGVTVVPVLSINQAVTVPVTGTGNCTVNGLLQVRADLTLAASSGSYTFRDGIVGTGTFTANNNTINLTGLTPKLGGGIIKTGATISVPNANTNLMLVDNLQFVSTGFGELRFSNGDGGKMTLGDYDCDLTNMRLSRTSIYNYFVTNGTGFLIQNAIAAFPLYVGPQQPNAASGYILFETAPPADISIKTRFVSSNPGTQGLPLAEGTDKINTVLPNGYWQIIPSAPITQSYDISVTAYNFTFIRYSYIDKTHLLKRQDESSPWILAGTHVTSTGSLAATPTSIILKRTGLTGFSEFAVGYFDAALPVTFATISAFIRGNLLKINWTTVKETNNDRFIIEISRDGHTFVKLHEVKSLAENGNSTGVLNYSYETNLQQAVGLLGGILLIIAGILLASGFISRRIRYRNSLIAAMIMVSGISLTSASCSKHNTDIMQKGNEKIFVRITQVDIDGATESSKVIRAISE